jgi:hypothetical protein
MGRALYLEGAPMESEKRLHRAHAAPPGSASPVISRHAKTEAL